MVNGIKMKMLGSQASRSNPPHGIFYSAPGGSKPLPHVVIRDILANFYRRPILDTLPPEVLIAMAGYIWIAGDTPGYLNWNRDPTKNALHLLPTDDRQYGPQRMASHLNAHRTGT